MWKKLHYFDILILLWCDTFSKGMHGKGIQKFKKFIYKVLSIVTKNQNKLCFRTIVTHKVLS